MRLKVVFFIISLSLNLYAGIEPVQTKDDAIQKMFDDIKLEEIQPTFTSKGAFKLNKTTTLSDLIRYRNIKIKNIMEDIDETEAYDFRTDMINAFATLDPSLGKNKSILDNMFTINDAKQMIAKAVFYNTTPSFQFDKDFMYRFTANATKYENNFENTFLNFKNQLRIGREIFNRIVYENIDDAFFIAQKLSKIDVEKYKDEINKFKSLLSFSNTIADNANYNSDKIAEDIYKLTNEYMKLVKKMSKNGNHDPETFISAFTEFYTAIAKPLEGLDKLAWWEEDGKLGKISKVIVALDQMYKETKYIKFLNNINNDELIKKYDGKLTLGDLSLINKYIVYHNKKLIGDFFTASIAIADLINDNLKDATQATSIVVKSLPGGEKYYEGGYKTYLTDYIGFQLDNIKNMDNKSNRDLQKLISDKIKTLKIIYSKDAIALRNKFVEGKTLNKEQRINLVNSLNKVMNIFHSNPGYWLVVDRAKLTRGNGTKSIFQYEPDVDMRVNLISMMDSLSRFKLKGKLYGYSPTYRYRLSIWGESLVSNTNTNPSQTVNIYKEIHESCGNVAKEVCNLDLNLSIKKRLSVSYAFSTDIPTQYRQFDYDKFKFILQKARGGKWDNIYIGGKYSFYSKKEGRIVLDDNNGWYFSGSDNYGEYPIIVDKSAEYIAHYMEQQDYKKYSYLINRISPYIAEKFDQWMLNENNYQNYKVNPNTFGLFLYTEPTKKERYEYLTKIFNILAKKGFIYRDEFKNFKSQILHVTYGEKYGGTGESFREFYVKLIDEIQKEGAFGNKSKLSFDNFSKHYKIVFDKIYPNEKGMPASFFLYRHKINKNYRCQKLICKEANKKQNRLYMYLDGIHVLKWVFETSVKNGVIPEEPPVLFQDFL